MLLPADVHTEEELNPEKLVPFTIKPVQFIVPLTSNSCDGADVPIPILPSFCIWNLLSVTSFSSNPIKKSLLPTVASF